MLENTHINKANREAIRKCIIMLSYAINSLWSEEGRRYRDCCVGCTISSNNNKSLNESNAICVKIGQREITLAKDEGLWVLTGELVKYLYAGKTQCTQVPRNPIREPDWFSDIVAMAMSEIEHVEGFSIGELYFNIDTNMKNMKVTECSVVAGNIHYHVTVY